jgi:hypothetical protein
LWNCERSNYRRIILGGSNSQARSTLDEASVFGQGTKDRELVAPLRRQVRCAAWAAANFR